MDDPVFFDQGGIDADFSRDNPDQAFELRMAKQVVTRHGATDWFSSNFLVLVSIFASIAAKARFGACALDKCMLI
jgi:hypothetical protein